MHVDDAHDLKLVAEKMALQIILALKHEQHRPLLQMLIRLLPLPLKFVLTMQQTLPSRHV